LSVSREENQLEDAMKSVGAIIMSVILMATLCTSAAFAGSEEEVVALVEKAVAMFKEKGKDYTLKVIGTLDGPFRKKEMYVYAASLDGILLAHPVNKDLVGKSQLGLKDAKGKLFGQELLKVAQEKGSGWVEYYWLRHGEKEPTLKKTYVLKVPGEDIAVAGGIYEK
jgi:methyl-accepting chemotaxis protein